MRKKNDFRRWFIGLLLALCASSSLADERTPVFVQFFDWFHTKQWHEEQFVDKPDWAQIGITGQDRSSELFYYKQFAYMKALV